MRPLSLLLISLISAYAVPMGEGESTVVRSNIERRQNSNYMPTSALAAAMYATQDGSKTGVFYRGDSRPPSQVLREGFKPQGQDMNLMHHLSFAGSSGYVSVSRSRSAAESYAFGRTGNQQGVGYLYVVAPNNLGEGYWIPGLFGRDGAVLRNQEFALPREVPSSAIVGAYALEKGNNHPTQWIPNGEYAFGKETPYSPGKDSWFAKPSWWPWPASKGQGRTNSEPLLKVAPRPAPNQKTASEPLLKVTRPAPKPKTVPQPPPVAAPPPPKAIPQSLPKAAPKPFPDRSGKLWAAMTPVRNLGLSGQKTPKIPLPTKGFGIPSFHVGNWMPKATRIKWPW